MHFRLRTRKRLIALTNYTPNLDKTSYMPLVAALRIFCVGTI